MHRALPRSEIDRVTHHVRQPHGPINTSFPMRKLSKLQKARLRLWLLRTSNAARLLRAIVNEVNPRLACWPDLLARLQQGIHLFAGLPLCGPPLYKLISSPIAEGPEPSSMLKFRDVQDVKPFDPMQWQPPLETEPRPQWTYSEESTPTSTGRAPRRRPSKTIKPYNTLPLRAVARLAELSLGPPPPRALKLKEVTLRLFEPMHWQPPFELHPRPQWTRPGEEGVLPPVICAPRTGHLKRYSQRAPTVGSGPQRQTQPGAKPALPSYDAATQCASKRSDSNPLRSTQWQPPPETEPRPQWTRPRWEQHPSRSSQERPRISA